MSQRRSQRLASQSSEQLIRQSSQVSESTQKSSRKKKEDSPKNLDLTGDRLNICLLLLLYTLQGVPMGLSSTVAFSLTEKGASFADQGVFSLASWPFSLKILWAPMIDALYVKKIGQRRTWLIPLQLLVGIALFILSGNLEQMIDSGAKLGDALADFGALLFLMGFPQIFDSQFMPAVCASVVDLRAAARVPGKPVEALEHGVERAVGKCMEHGFQLRMVKLPRRGRRGPESCECPLGSAQAAQSTCHLDGQSAQQLWAVRTRILL